MDLYAQQQNYKKGIVGISNKSDGNLRPEIYERYEKIASSGVGMINMELVSLYPNDIFTQTPSGRFAIRLEHKRP